MRETHADPESGARPTASAFPRDLTEQERGILDFILGQEWEGAHGVRAMLRETRVTGMCSCGCGSIELSVDPEAPTEEFTTPSPVPAEAVARVDGKIVGFFLFINDDGGYLDFVWYCDPEERPGRLPRLDELQIPEWRGAEPGSGVLTNFDS